MIFNSIDFLIFLSIVLPTFFLLSDRYRIPFLVVASYYFYGYWSWGYLLLLLFTMGVDYVIALAMNRTPSEGRRKHLLVLSIVLNLGVLFVFKYFNLFSDLFAAMAGRAPFRSELILPFGISFYTFHAMSYTIDVYRRVIPAERDFILYSGYIMFFPQLVAGPIARASHLLHQFEEKKRFKLENFIEGSYLIARGYFFKVVLADAFGGFVDAYFSDQVTRTPLLMTQSIYFFAFQIYCDFCGYTDIARGIARWFDFRLVDNFHRPYFATSITDFWRRWHISLSTWLRDYLYIPLGGNRGGRLATYRNLMITMLLGGLWHGASWTFVVWGGLHGLYLSVEKALGVGKESRVPAIVRRLFVFHLVCFAWIFFRAADFQQAWMVLTYVGKVFTTPFMPGEIHIKLWVMALFLFSFETCEARLDLQLRFQRAPAVLRVALIYGAIAFISLFAELNPRSFIYFQF